MWVFNGSGQDLVPCPCPPALGAQSLSQQINGVLTFHHTVPLKFHSYLVKQLPLLSAFYRREREVREVRELGPGHQ